MVEALKEQGVDVPYMIKDNEGHGFYNEENRFDFYREMTEFLEKISKKLIYYDSKNTIPISVIF